MKSLTLAGSAAAPEGRTKAWLRCLMIVGRSHGFNMTASQIIKDNLLDGEETTCDEMITCAQQAGLKARRIRLDFDQLNQLRKALPAVIRLKTGGAMVLTEVYANGEVPFVRLRDPDADEGVSLVIDRLRLEEIWTGEVVLIRREYKLLDDEKPFGWPVIFAMFLRERRMLRDVAIGSFALSALAIVPMMTWRILAGSVMTYRAFNTFTVVCVAVGVLFAFEGLLTFLRGYLIQIITARVDTRMTELIFDRLLNLRIDFFERTQIGSISHDIQEAQKIRKFINESGFVTVLDSLTLIIILPIMFAFSALLTFIVLGVTALMALMLIVMLPAIRRDHSASQAALTGGGHRARPGEVSLAHRGVLFLDELPEFPRQTLEALRQPMETGKTTVSRASAHITYPARFQLVAAMNPCRCGYLGDADRECGRAPRCGEDYRNRISGPVLDRIDLAVEVQPATAAELAYAPRGESSATIAERVNRARTAVRDRHGPDGPLNNAEVESDAIRLSSDATKLVESAMNQMRLSGRGRTRVLRVARTIADLAGAQTVDRQHVAEALSYRHRTHGRVG